MKNLFLKPNDPNLKKVTKAISNSQISSARTQEIIETMLRVAYGEQKDESKPIMVGLAAPQIGILKRIILVDTKADGKGKVGNLKIYINPKIVWQSKRAGEWYEGCFSTGRICGIVSRPISIKIQAYIPKYNLSSLRKQGSINNTVKWIPAYAGMTSIIEKHTGYIARILQHEIDHLNGILFLDHIKNPDNLHWVKEHEFPLYRNKETWRHWTRKYSRPC